jgi:aspartyl-tRNA(Asn)/glutamyl-tRNA(Gln) amidotransferase subunit A
MLPEVSPLNALKQALADGTTTPVAIGQQCADRANKNAPANTYIGFDREALLKQAEGLGVGGPLYGVPVSLKDLFDLAGTPTSAGTRFYAEVTPVAGVDSSLAARLKATGCLITGKTHLHPLAYGLTGENPDYGDCVQPRDAGLLTGGSSSGAVASVQEGSALAAIGTDTGGSVRIPAALCGLAGYRASHALPTVWPELWRGGMHLAPSFDTVGLFTRDPRDLGPIASELFCLPKPVTTVRVGPRIGCVAMSFCTDADAEVRAAYEAWKQALAESGATVVEFEPVGWDTATAIYAAIQASEAWAIHRRYFDRLAPMLEERIVQRLEWGRSLTEEDMDSLRSRQGGFRAAVAGLLGQFDLLLMPSSPVNRLPVGADYTAARNKILRYTSPFSLAGLPVVTLPGELLERVTGEYFGTGVQLAAAQMEDAALLEWVAGLRV